MVVWDDPGLDDLGAVAMHLNYSALPPSVEQLPPYFEAYRPRLSQCCLDVNWAR